MIICNVISDNCCFRGLNISDCNIKIGTMEGSGSSVKHDEQQGDCVSDEGKLRDHLVRAFDDAMKKEPLSDATDSVDDKTEAGVKVEGAAGYITGCGDRGALSSSEEEEEEMLSASSTLSRTQRKVFQHFPLFSLLFCSGSLHLYRQRRFGHRYD